MQEYREVPVYRTILPFWDGDDLIDPDMEIEFDGIPNEHMEPLNEAARERMIDFLHTLQDGKRTPDLGDIVMQQMQKRPREASELTSPELKAALELIQRSKEKQNSPEEQERKRAVVLPKAKDVADIPMMGNDLSRMETNADGSPKRKTKILRQSKPTSDPTKRRRITSNYSTATIEGREYE